ncbi:hypothetical protein PIB30_036661 [Stylosanthes scabra]|uniref:Uncharacterized protein n=1 Tax=Stylosanthes scabra TaxID=79078 RepID=A0ABU6WBK1_9FABA|nr:hypothetical protein [Stylosanthes scabra]
MHRPLRCVCIWSGSSLDVTPKSWQCVRIGSGFVLQAFLCDLLVPRALFSHFRSELCLSKPEILERTHQGILAENFVQTAMHNHCPSLAFLSNLTSFEAARQSVTVSLSPFFQNRLVVAAADVGVIPFDILAPAFQYISLINLIHSLITQDCEKMAA